MEFDQMEQSRADKIRLARESCHANRGQSNYRTEQSKIHTFSQYETTDSLQTPRTAKSFLIRSIFALFLFAGFIVMKQFNLSYQQWDSKQIQAVIISNQKLEQLEQYIIQIGKEKIIPVFHRLEE